MVCTNGKKIWQLSDCEAVYTSCPYQIRYITGMEPENGSVIVDKDGATLYTDMRYIEAAEKLFAGTDVTPVLGRKDEIFKRLAEYKTVGVSFAQTTHAEYLALEKAGVTLKDMDGAYEKGTSVKNEWELANIRKACQIAEDGFNALLSEIQALGAQGLAFETIVAFGANAAVPHHETGLTKLQFGDEILIDFGCRVNGYCSDITRTFLFGDDGKHEEFKKAYQAVLKAHELVKEKLKSGMTGIEGDAIAREHLKAKGYGDKFTHSLGHGIGLNIHEFPSVSPRGETALEDGMVFSDEPGVYFAGEFGIRIEDTVTLKEGKVKSFMSKTDRNLIIL